MSSNIGTGSSGSSRSQNSSGSGSGSGGDSPVPKHAGNDWKEEKSFNYGAKPPHIKPPSSYSTMQQHVKGVYPTHTGLVSSTHSDTISRQSVESYNHGGMMASSIAPSPTPTATKAGSSNADSTVTLRTADCYKPLTTCAPQAWKHPANRSALTQAGAPCEGYSLSLGPQVKATYSATEQPGLKKLKNIVLSVIAPGVLAPRGPGDTSPQGLFTPNPTLRNSQVMQQESANRRNHDDKGNFIHGFRNLPSSNSSNASEPL